MAVSIEQLHNKGKHLIGEEHCLYCKYESIGHDRAVRKCIDVACSYGGLTSYGRARMREILSGLIKKESGQESG